MPEFKPRLVFWETTAGCNLSCIHCRRIDVADQLVPEDLTTAESFEMIDQIAALRFAQGQAFANPILVLSGGEPLFRPDIFTIARYASDKGLRVALATNGTLINQTVAQRIVEAGVRRVAISFDGANAETHDQFRALPGSFDRAVAGVRLLREAGMSVQINTTVARHNIHQMQPVMDLALALGADALHLFLLVPVGCGVEIADEQMISPNAYEDVLNWLYDREKEGRIEVRATCAPHYLRIKRQRAAQERQGRPSQLSEARLNGQGSRGAGERGGCGDTETRRHGDAEIGFITGSPRPRVPASPRHPGGLHSETKGCLAGTGVCFVSHKGEVFPCGYLPVEAGNIRRQTFREIWEQSFLFTQLRDPGLLGGKCGFCEFKNVCSGCRARAFGMTMDYLGEEPFCVYEPHVRETAKQ